MRVCVIAADEKRDRQKFVSVPLVDAGHDVRVIKTRPLFKYFYNLFLFCFFRQPDVCVFVGEGPKELLALFLVKLIGVPHVLRLGGDILRDLNSVIKSSWDRSQFLSWAKFLIYKYVAARFLKMVDTVIVVNQELERKISNQLKGSSEIFLIPQFCEGDGVARDYRINGKRLELLTVANFRFSDKAKGVIWMIKQLNSAMCRVETPLHYTIAGDGAHLNDLRDYLARAHISEYLDIDLVGYVSDLDAIYRCADVFLYCSSHDATPNVILESKRYGIPLLVNKCEEFLNIVEHGVSGLLYRDKEEFCLFFRQILMDQELREKVGRGALREHDKIFSRVATMRKLDDAILKVANGPARHR
jgi:glycosyltransferase involved in cell wall biosynthesis